MSSLDGISNPHSTNSIGAEVRANSPLGGPLDMGDVRSWYEAMARAWGQTLDRQAQVINDLSDTIGNGGEDQPSTIVQLTAESMRMQFLSNNAATANNSVGQALEALGRRQG